MKRLLICCVFSLLAFSAANAQFNNCERWSMGANFTVTEPNLDMSFNGFRTAYGATFNVLYNMTPELSHMNMHIGARISGGVTKGERDGVILNDPDGALARSSIYNTLADMLIMGRVVMRPEKKFQYYFDYYAGGRITGANQDLRLNSITAGYDRRSSDRLVQSANWAWGTGAGVLIQFRKNAYFDFGINYMESDENRFVDLDSYSIDNEDYIQYDVVNSLSNSLGVHIGFHFTLECGEETYRDNRRNRRNRRYRTTRNRKPRAKKPNTSRTPTKN